jgi:hypothetical protein
LRTSSRRRVFPPPEPQASSSSAIRNHKSKSQIQITNPNHKSKSQIPTLFRFWESLSILVLTSKKFWLLI